MGQRNLQKIERNAEKFSEQKKFLTVGESAKINC